MKHEWIFKYLDNGTFLKNLEEITKLTSGNVLYYGLSHAHSFFSKINHENLGLIHSGQLGDVVISSFSTVQSSSKSFKFGDGAYSKKLLNRIKNFEFNKFDLIIDNQTRFKNTLIYKKIPHKYYVSPCLNYLMSNSVLFHESSFYLYDNGLLLEGVQ